jgi:hypothetical protein
VAPALVEGILPLNIGNHTITDFSRTDGDKISFALIDTDLSKRGTRATISSAERRNLRYTSLA